MSGKNNLPDTSQWEPRDDKAKTITEALRSTLRAGERRIVVAGENERLFNLDNYDSGPGIEDVVREELRALLPSRYDVMAAVVADATGRTCGECDVAVLNSFWVPLLKRGSESTSRRKFVPVESVYSVVEVKQTLTEPALDQAMEKIVKYKRLTRRKSEGMFTENRGTGAAGRGVGNCRFDLVIATRADKKFTFMDAVERFFAVNEKLSGGDKVNMLVCLGTGVAYYSENMPAPTLYPFDPAARPEDQGNGSSPYFVETDTDSLYLAGLTLLTHLHRTVLNPSNLVNLYGAAFSGTKYGGRTRVGEE